MQFTITTEKMKTILDCVSHGMSNGKLLEAAEYIKLKLVDGTLTAQATNGSHFITYVEKGVGGFDGEVVVKGETLIQLVNRTTKPEIKFALHFDKEKNAGFLQAEGNGKYKLQILLQPYPTYEWTSEVAPIEFDVASFKSAFLANDAARAKDPSLAHLTGHYVGSVMLATDTTKMSLFMQEFLPNHVVLLPEFFMELLLTLTDDRAQLYVDDNRLFVRSSNILLYGAQLSGVSEFPSSEVILSLSNMEYPISLSVSRKDMESALSRILLFVEPFDDNAVSLSITDDNMLEVADLKGRGTEYLTFSGELANSKVTTAVNASYLNDLVRAIKSETLELEMGPDLPLRMRHEKTRQLLAPINA